MISKTRMRKDFFLPKIEMKKKYIEIIFFYQIDKGKETTCDCKVRELVQMRE